MSVKVEPLVVGPAIVKLRAPFILTHSPKMHFLSSATEELILMIFFLLEDLSLACDMEPLLVLPVL